MTPYLFIFVLAHEQNSNFGLHYFVPVNGIEYCCIGEKMEHGELQRVVVSDWIAENSPADQPRLGVQ